MTKARDIASAAPAPAGVTSTELGYVDGVTSALQTQLNAKAEYPSQTGNNGKYLTTNGTSPSWGTVTIEEPGLKLIEAKTITGESSTSFNNVFSSTYENYKIVIALEKSSSTGFSYMRFRASSSDNTTSVYYSNANYKQVDGTAVGEAKVSAGTAMSFNDGADIYTSLDVFKPNVAAKTYISGTENFFKYSTQFYQGSFVGLFNNTTQFDGFTIYPASGTITGTIRVYGYRN
jgi:hypothetical protein